MIHPQPLSVVILAGGKSSRMGQDKALIPINGVPLIRHVCNVAMELSENIYIVTSRSQNYHGYLPRSCQYIVEQETYGPLVAFAQALKVVKTEWILLLACDLPNINSSVFKGWLEQLKHIDRNAIAALVRNPKGWETLCGFYRVSAWDDLNIFIEQGGNSFQTWLKRHQIHELFTSDINLFFNCNTPADLERKTGDRGSELQTLT